MNFKREFSSGGVVFKKVKTKKVLFLLGKHSGYHKWVLPKGLIEKGEKGAKTAVRETKEEMGVTARLVIDKPIYKEQYYFVADYKEEKKSKSEQPTRRIDKYDEEGGGKIKVFKTVTFYLLEYVSGDPKDHDWEMSEAGWYDFDQAHQKLAFKGEKEALVKANQLLPNFC